MFNRMLSNLKRAENLGGMVALYEVKHVEQAYSSP